MTPESRQSSNIGNAWKYGAPGAIRTPGLLIRRLRALRLFIFIFRGLPLILCLKLIGGFSGLFRVRQIVCQNYARVNTPLPGKPPSHRWNQLEVLLLCTFIRSVLLSALKAPNGLRTAPILLQRGRPLNKAWYVITCLCPKPVAAIGQIGVIPCNPVLSFTPYGTGNAGRHMKGEKPRQKPVEMIRFTRRKLIEMKRFRSVVMTMQCIKCYDEKPDEDFYKGKRECKTCYRARQVKNYHRDLETSRLVAKMRYLTDDKMRVRLGVAAMKRYELPKNNDVEV